MKNEHKVERVESGVRVTMECAEGHRTERTAATELEAAHRVVQAFGYNAGATGCEACQCICHPPL